MRWPRFVREEIEAQYHPWGRWLDHVEEDGSVTRIWTGKDPGRRCRRLKSEVVTRLQLRRLSEWAESGARPARRRPVSRGRLKGSVGAWEREIRIEGRRRRFERAAHASAGIHATRLAFGRFRND